MATSIKSTQLDFNTIKEELKTHFLASTEFADYDFEASGLSNILDVLAYNTHYNGLTANFALNESFLQTAQLRSSVLGIAETLGYNPRSQTSATGTVNISVTVTGGGGPAAVTLPTNTVFNASIDDVSYTFRTTESYIASDDGNGRYSFLTTAGSPNISISEGTYKTKTFIADNINESFYIIPDLNMDKETAVVQVFPTRTSTTFDTYLPLFETARVDSESKLFTLREAANGHYSVIFGDGITTGKTPAVGSVIVVTYLQTKAAAANAANNFIAATTLDIDGTTYALDVTTISRAAGGADKESMNSIKANAPITFAAQNRLVTASDYIALIKRNYGSFLDDVTAWGGEDNAPKKYGCVYVSLKFKADTPSSVQDSVKTNIETVLTDNLAIMGVDTIFADAVTSFLETQTTFNYDPEQTQTTPAALEARIQNLISEYFSTNLNVFNKIFRRSNLLSEVDDLSAAILNSKMVVKVQQRLVPSLNIKSSYEISYPVTLQSPNNVEYIVSSTPFTQSGTIVTIRNILNSTTLEAVDASNTVIIDNIGSYNPATGKINLIGLDPTSIVGSAAYIKISALPANQSTIKPLRNFIFEVDQVNSYANAIADYQTVGVAL